MNIEDLVFGAVEDQKGNVVFVSMKYGKFMQRVDSNTEGAIRREYSYKNEQRVCYEKQHAGFIGFLGNIKRSESPFKNQLDSINIWLKTPSQSVCISTNIDSNHFNYLASRIKNIDFEKPVFVSCFEGNKQKDGVDVQPVVKITHLVIRQWKEGDDTNPQKWSVLKPYFDVKKHAPAYKWIEAGKNSFFDKTDSTEFFWKCVSDNWLKNDFDRIKDFFPKQAKENSIKSVASQEVEPLDSDIDFSKDEYQMTLTKNRTDESGEGSYNPNTDSTNPEDDLPF